MIAVFFKLHVWAVRSTVYEQPNLLKVSILALGLPERLN